MDLTDEQWALIQPLIPPTSPYSRGRPPADPRATLNGIFRKIRLGEPWYNLPPYAVGRHPSWQTCYRAYRRWGSVGIIDQIFKILEQHLIDQGGLDLYESLWIQTSTSGPYKLAKLARSANPDLDDGDIKPVSGILNQDPDQAAVIITAAKSGWRVHLSPDLDNTWQGSTARLLAQDFVAKVRARIKLAP
jgi:transposase